MLLLFGVGLIIVVPLLAGSDRRAQMHSYISTTRLGKGAGHRHSPELSSHIAPPSGGIPDEEDVPLTLEARLKYLLERPALEQFEAELPNRHACPMFTYARNTYFFHEGKDEHWKAITANDVRQYRRRMVDYFRDLDDDGKTKLVWDKSMEANTPADQRRGIIYTGGEGVSILYQVPGCLLPARVQIIKTFIPFVAWLGRCG
jgi:hypothetical protein